MRFLTVVFCGCEVEFALCEAKDAPDEGQEEEDEHGCVQFTRVCYCAYTSSLMLLFAAAFSMHHDTEDRPGETAPAEEAAEVLPPWPNAESLQRRVCLFVRPMAKSQKTKQKTRPWTPRTRMEWMKA